MNDTSLPALGNAADATITPPDTAPAPPSTPLTQPVSAMERLLAEAGIDTSLLPQVDPSTTIRFSEEFTRTLVHDYRQTDDAILLRQQAYEYHTKRFSDAPKPEELTIEDVPLLLSIRLADNPTITSWKEFKESQREKTRNVREAQNPFLCLWLIKSETQAHPFYKAMCEVPNDSAFGSDEAKFAFNSLILAYTPQGKDPSLALGCAPTDNERFLNEVVDAFCVHLRHFAVSLGENSETDFNYRWGPMVVLTAGLGFRSLRRVAEHLQEIDADWAGVAMSNDADLRKLVITCRRLSGFPAGLLRVPADRLFAFFEERGLVRLPWAFRMVFVLHLFIYTRLIPDAFGPGTYGVLVLFNGIKALLPLMSDGYNAPLNASTNSGTMHAVCRILGIPADKQKGNNANNTMRNAINAILGTLNPCHLLRQRDMAECPHLIVPPCTMYAPKLEQHSERLWANHGMRVGPIGSIDLDTGRVDAQTYIENEDAIALAFGFADFKETTYESWKLMLPEQVDPVLPSSYLMGIVKNLNTLGKPVGFAGMIDTIMLIGSSRSALASTILGAPLANEFPFVVSLPTGSTKDETTQQGKTNVVRVLANVLVPGLKPTMVPTRQSAPGDRAVTSDMSKYGTMIADELHVRGNDGIINITSLQGMLTGGVIAPGKAGENAEPIGLKYPLFASMKFNDVPPDIRNRQAPIFLDALTDANRANDKESNLLLSGPLALHMALSLAMWKYKNHFIERVRNLTWTASKGWRFPAHYLVAQHILGVGEAVVAYLQAAEAMCEQQFREAEAAGTVMDTGSAPKFDPAWFCRNCSELTLETIYQQQLNGPLKSGEMLRKIVEDGIRRDYRRELAYVHITEQGAASAFARRANGLEFGSWKLVFTDSARKQKVVTLIKTRAATGVPSEVTPQVQQSSPAPVADGMAAPEESPR